MSEHLSRRRGVHRRKRTGVAVSVGCVPLLGAWLLCRTVIGRVGAIPSAPHKNMRRAPACPPAFSEKTPDPFCLCDPFCLLLSARARWRVYRLSLVPRIIESPKPTQFHAKDLFLERWDFGSSPVIINDEDYRGQLGMFGGPLAFCDMPGLARFEFSLLHLKDAEPLGTLENGVINITHQDTTIRISDVRNGTNPQVLAGDPYRVWVRWTGPTQSIEEYRESIKHHIASLKERVLHGELLPPPGSLKRLEQMSASDRVVGMVYGIGPVPPRELADSDK